ncbi:MAG: hypothetical protein ACD_39C01199G0002 [uncultured bacterium]|nr:MAG: hypothetical protein ACD_39C01199G0002 [uncultured bacterium]
MGILSRPLSILKVEDRDGNLLEENLPRAKEVMKAVNAAMICDMLRTAVERGTGAKAKVPGKAIAGKTGTTNDYVDAWFNGMSPDLVTIVQFGFDMPKTLGRGKAGGAVAGPPWKAFMEKALEHYPNKDFPVPDGAVRARVCMSSGKLASKGCPGSEVVGQIFPIESQPLTECRHGMSAAVAGGFAGEVEDADVALQTDESFLPDPDFFHSNYQSGAAAASNQPAQVVKPPTVQGEWISRDNPDRAVLQRWGADKQIPNDAFIDDSLADAPAVEDESPADIPAVEEESPAPAREPGVVINPPGVEFRDSYH